MRLSRRRVRPLVLLSALSLTQACSKSPEPPPAKTDDIPAAPADEKAPAPADEKAPAPVVAADVPVNPETMQDTPAIAEIGEVIATAQIPTGTAMTDLAAFADVIQPNASMFLEMQAPKLLEEGAGMKLDGAKLDGPVSIVVLDPTKHTSPVGLFVAVEDSAKLTAAAAKAGKGYEEFEGYALLGPEDVVAAASDWAFANLTKAPDHSEVIIYPAPLMAAAGPLVDQAMEAANAEFIKQGNPGMTALMSVYQTGFRSLVDQTARIVVSVSPGQQGGDINMHLYPKAGSAMEGFTAALAPSDHALLAKLPQVAGPSLIMSGELHSGGAHEALVSFMAEASLAMYKTDLDAQAWATMMSNWLDTLDGRVAMVIDASAMAQGKPKMAMSGLMGANDSDKMRQVWRELIQTFVKVSGSGDTEMMGMGISGEFKPDIKQHEGVTIDGYETTLDFSKLPEEQRAMLEDAGATQQGIEFAAFDSYGAMSSTEGAGSVTTLIDAARGKGESFTPTASLSAAVADSKAHGESFFYYMDLGAIAPPEAQGQIPFSAVSANLGRLPDALSFRVSLRK